MNKPANTVIRLAVSLTFIFSGLVKLNDPVGFALKIEAYLRAFSLDFTILFLKLMPYTLALAVGVSTLEVVLGVALIIKFQAKFTLRALLLLTIFFTCLTFYTAAFKRLGSCGCFGDALPLTPWQSFSKSILLLLALSLLYKSQKAIITTLALTSNLYWIILSGVYALTLGWYTISRLPIVDFRPYKVGNNIALLTQPSAPLRYKYFVEKDGQIVETITYPQNTSYPSVKAELLNPAARPVITNFTIWDEQGEVTQEVLQGSKLLIIVQRTDKVDAATLHQLESFIHQLHASVQPVWVIPFHKATASLTTFLATPLYWASAKLLKTMMRADLGFVLLQDGIVAGKWSYQDLSRTQKDLAKLGFYRL